MIFWDWTHFLYASSKNTSIESFVCLTWQETDIQAANGVRPWINVLTNFSWKCDVKKTTKNKKIKNSDPRFCGTFLPAPSSSWINFQLIFLGLGNIRLSTVTLSCTRVKTTVCFTAAVLTEAFIEVKITMANLDLNNFYNKCLVSKFLIFIFVQKWSAEKSNSEFCTNSVIHLTVILPKKTDFIFLKSMCPRRTNRNRVLSLWRPRPMAVTSQSPIN